MFFEEVGSEIALVSISVNEVKLMSIVYEIKECVVINKRELCTPYSIHKISVVALVKVLHMHLVLEERCCLEYFGSIIVHETHENPPSFEKYRVYYENSSRLSMMLPVTYLPLLNLSDASS